MTDNDHGPSGETSSGKFTWGPDDVTVLKAGDEDYDDEEIVGDDDERVDEDDEGLEILDEPDGEEEL
jgi:hypothetical protein